jgi:PKD repeat protein
MKKFRLIISIQIIAIMLFVVVGGLQVFPIPVLAHNGNPHLVKTFIGPDGQEIDELVFPVKPPAVKEKPAKVPQPNLQMGINYVSGLVPAFDWSYGCSATSAAMLFGYYDRTDYSDMYTGPTNAGVCPETNFVWGYGESPLSATHEEIDGRQIKGHVDDYWITYLDPGPDPYEIYSWPEHTLGDCTGDYMGTNQEKYGNVDGGTTFYFYTDGSPLYDYTGSEPSSRDGGHGMKLFAESRGYTVTATFNQYIRGEGTNHFKGFTFANYVAEIDAGRPVLIQVSGHTMLGFGYNTTGNIVYLHDTWDYSDHTMAWGGSYAGMQHYGVTVFRLAASVLAAPVAAFSGSPTTGTAPLTVNFSNFSTGISPLTYAWDFDNDGVVDSTAQNPSYTYISDGTYSVKLTVTNAGGNDEELKTNYITVTAAPVVGSITVISPNGREVWKIGTNKKITWTSSNIAGNVKIELSRTDSPSSTWETIIASTSNTGTYAWRVTGPATKTARIRVSNADSSVSDISNANFTIK